MVGFGVKIKRPVGIPKEQTNKIVVVLNGTLGEQLFQCAMGIGLSYELGVSLECYSQSKRGFFDSYLHMIKFGSVSTNNIIRYEKQTKYTQYTIDDMPLILSGLYQSESYFKKHRNHVLRTLTLPDKYKKKIELKYKRMMTNKLIKVSIRIERSKTGTPPLSTDYYTRACSNFNTDYLFVVITDDIDWCKQHDFLKMLPNIEFVSGETDYCCLYLESICNHHIISNNMDSWWAAYLGDGSRCRTVCPSVWFYNDADFDKDFIPQKWIVV
jgi:hypothetical protein